MDRRRMNQIGGMTMAALAKTNAQLPTEAATQLRTVREESTVLFGAWVIALRNNRWPYRAIGDVFGVSRVAAQAWYNRALADDESIALADTLQDVPQLPSNARGSQVRVQKITPDVLPEDRTRLKELTSTARVVGRWTPMDADSRKAAHELEELVYQYVVVRKVPAAAIARYAGVTRRAIIQRLEKRMKQLEEVA